MLRNRRSCNILNSLPAERAPSQVLHGFQGSPSWSVAHAPRRVKTKHKHIRSHLILDFETLHETSCYWWKILIGIHDRFIQFRSTSGEASERSRTTTTRRFHPSASRHQIRQFKRSLRCGWSHLFQVPANKCYWILVNCMGLLSQDTLCPVLSAVHLQ